MIKLFKNFSKIFFIILFFNIQAQENYVSSTDINDDKISRSEDAVMKLLDIAQELLDKKEYKKAIDLLLHTKDLAIKNKLNYFFENVDLELAIAYLRFYQQELNDEEILNKSYILFNQLSEQNDDHDAKCLAMYYVALIEFKYLEEAQTDLNDLIYKFKYFLNNFSQKKEFKNSVKSVRNLAYIMLGEIYLKLKNNAESIKYFRLATFGKYKFNAYMFLGKIFDTSADVDQDLKKYKTALYYYTCAYNNVPQNYDHTLNILSKIIELYGLSNDLEGAIEFCSHLITKQNFEIDENISKQLLDFIKLINNKNLTSKILLICNFIANNSKVIEISEEAKSIIQKKWLAWCAW